jgi:hypothetical protein
MKRVILVSSILLILAISCAPTPTPQIATATLAPSQTSMPTLMPAPTNTPASIPTVTASPDFVAEISKLPVIWTSPLAIDATKQIGWGNYWKEKSLEGGTMRIVNDPSMGQMIEYTVTDENTSTYRIWLTKYANRDVAIQPPWSMKIRARFDGITPHSGGWFSFISVFNGNFDQENPDLIAQLNMGPSGTPYISAKKPGPASEIYQEYRAPLRLQDNKEYEIIFGLDSDRNLNFFLDGILRARGIVDPNLKLLDLVGFRFGIYGQKLNKGAALWEGPAEVRGTKRK